MQPLQTSNRARCQALTAALAYAQGDLREFHKSTDGVFDLFGGYRELVAGLADLLVESLSVEHDGDPFAVTEAIRVRRSLAAVAP